MWGDGRNELFDFFQDAYLVAETLAGNVPEVPTPDDYFTSPDGWAATRAALGTSFPNGLTPTGERFKASSSSPVATDRRSTPAEEAAFNARMVRLTADPQSRHPNGLGRLPGSAVVSPPISGDIFHCSFSEQERIAAFDDLVTWVEDGIRPAGDDILSRAVVADPRFGCRFTEPDRSFLPPC